MPILSKSHSNRIMKVHVKVVNFAHTVAAGTYRGLYCIVWSTHPFTHLIEHDSPPCRYQSAWGTRTACQKKRFLEGSCLTLFSRVNLSWQAPRCNTLQKCAACHAKSRSMKPLTTFHGARIQETRPTSTIYPIFSFYSRMISEGGVV